MMNYIKALEELEQKISCAPNGSQVIEWEAGNGLVVHGQSVGDLTGEDAGVVRTFLPKGAALPSHIHDDAVEIVVCVTGEVECFAGEMRQKTIKAGDCFRVTKGESHRFIANEDSSCIVVGVPNPRGFPR